jgi:CyaY protein
MNAPFEPTPLADSEYHAITSALLARVEATVDQWLQDDLVDIDTHRTGGLLELGFPDGSKIVINTQPPLHELWLAARRGGYHYKYAQGSWRDTRDGREFHEALSACASEQAGKTLRFEQPLSA